VKLEGRQPTGWCRSWFLSSPQVSETRRPCSQLCGSLIPLKPVLSYSIYLSLVDLFFCSFCFFIFVHRGEPSEGQPLILYQRMPRCYSSRHRPSLRWRSRFPSIILGRYSSAYGKPSARLSGALSCGQHRTAECGGRGPPGEEADGSRVGGGAVFPVPVWDGAPRAAGYAFRLDLLAKKEKHTHTA